MAFASYCQPCLVCHRELRRHELLRVLSYAVNGEHAFFGWLVLIGRCTWRLSWLAVLQLRACARVGGSGL